MLEAVSRLTLRRSRNEAMMHPISNFVQIYFRGTAQCSYFKRHALTVMRTHDIHSRIKLKGKATVADATVRVAFETI